MTIDKSNFKKAIDEFPNQLTEAVKLAKDIKQDGKFGSVVVAGVGGSSYASDLVSEYIKNSVPIFIARSYSLPREAREDSLVFVSSFSGNTEETMSCMDEAEKRGLKMIGFSQGGELEERCTKKGIPFVKYPAFWKGYQPRWAGGLSFASFLTVMANSGLIEKPSSALKTTAEKLKKMEFDDEAKRIAKSLYKKIPLFYGPQNLKFLARAWKMNVTENAKVPAFWNFFPEVNHHETMGFTNPLIDKFQIVDIVDPSDNPKIEKRMKITAELLKEKGIGTTVATLPDEDLLTKICAGLMMGLKTCYYLAMEYKIDPAPIDLVDKLKEMMKK